MKILVRLEEIHISGKSTRRIVDIRPQRRWEGGFYFYGNILKSPKIKIFNYTCVIYFEAN